MIFPKNADINSSKPLRNFRRATTRKILVKHFPYVLQIEMTLTKIESRHTDIGLSDYY